MIDVTVSVQEERIEWSGYTGMDSSSIDFRTLLQTQSMSAVVGYMSTTTYTVYSAGIKLRYDDTLTWLDVEQLHVR